jgi:DNA (cytosine-5)-methyltransferase 1
MAVRVEQEAEAAESAPRSDRLPARGVIERVDELLEIRYRGADLGNVTDVLAEAVYILITKQTREAVYQRVFAALCERFERWEDVRNAPLNQLESLLRPAGLQAQRARDLKLLLEGVHEDNVTRGVGPAAGDDLTLEYLREEPEGAAERFLRGLAGLGPKTARCVTLYALGKDDFPVDTHVARIFDRLGLVKMTGWKPAHDEYQQAVPARIRGRLHVNLVHHGRAVCRNTEPRCDECPLVSFCEMGRQRVARAKCSEAPLAVDLFAGAGGMALGFEQAGFRVAAAVEMDRAAAQTYRLNHPGVPVLEADVTEITAAALQEFAPAIARGVAATVAGPPCQGYSFAGPRDPHAERNYLYEHVIRIARELGSSGIVIENVPGAASVRGVEFADSIVSELQAAGFAADKHLLQGPDFGVPQRRKRFFFVGIDKELGVKPSAPSPTHRPPGTDGELEPTPTLTTLLSRLPARSHGVADDRMELADGTVVYNAATMAHGKDVVKKIRKILPGQGPLSYRRLDGTLATTIIAGHRALPVHPTLDRTISVREAALIQGFPLGYTFCGFRSQQPLQVANAVPPPLAGAVARQVAADVRSAASAAGVLPARNGAAGVIGRGEKALQPLGVPSVIEDEVAAVS